MAQIDPLKCLADIARVSLRALCVLAVNFSLHADPVKRIFLPRKRQEREEKKRTHHREDELERTKTVAAETAAFRTNVPRWLAGFSPFRPSSSRTRFPTFPPRIPILASHSQSFDRSAQPALAGRGGSQSQSFDSSAQRELRTPGVR
jgi:hypothetical protein